MFTGIIEDIGDIQSISQNQKNKIFTIQSSISSQLTVDQSIAHNGVCLTVIEQEQDWHKVAAIRETLERSNCSWWEKGTSVNLERCLEINGRLDGHIVQGHVDGRGNIINMKDDSGSTTITIQHQRDNAALVIPKGSITIDGVSLTIVSCDLDTFKISIIPYTWEHTIFHTYRIGSIVNIEYDIIGKYLLRFREVGV